MMQFILPDATDVNGAKYMKVFYLSMDFEANWMDSRSFCKTFDMDLVTFDSSYEYSNFLKHAMKSVSYFDKWTHIGGVSKFVGKHRDWYWVNTNRRVTYNMQFAVGQVKYMPSWTQKKVHGQFSFSQTIISVDKIAWEFQRRKKPSSFRTLTAMVDSKKSLYARKFARTID
jgi:hypothetical protein